MSRNKERLLISLRDFKAHRLPAGGPHVKIPGLGVVDPEQVSEIADGDLFEFCGEAFVVIGEKGLGEMLATAERRAQIITMKDIGPVVARLGIGPGAKVVEVGAGSGYLTISLAHFVGESGRVETHEIEPKSVALVKKNLEAAGLDSRVAFVEGDAAEHKGAGDADAFVADMPNPWDVLPFAESSLKPGKWAAFYTPSANQVERLAKQLRARGWAQEYSMETLERQMVVGEHGIRPSFEMLGHTGYLTFARWLGPGAAARLAGKKR
jgi:tRNA (adenine57-N1/adenine58-N1)-methyltransferase